MKKPGEFKAAQERNRRQQRHRDALKKLHEGKTVWLMIEGRRTKVAPMDKALDLVYQYPGPTVLARCPKAGRGYKLMVGLLYDKDGLKLATGEGTFRMHEKHLLGQVVEEH